MASSEPVNLTNPPAAKKAKFANDSTENLHESIKDLSNFKLTSILQNNTNRKSVCLKGIFENREGDALVLLEKTAFTEENLQPNSDYFTSKSYLEKVFQNDIYGDFKYFPKLDLNCMSNVCFLLEIFKFLSIFSC